MKDIFFSYRKKDGYEDVFESDSPKELYDAYKNGRFQTGEIKNVAIYGKPAPAEITTVTQLLDLFPLQAPISVKVTFVKQDVNELAMRRAALDAVRNGTSLEVQ